jgi:hypothetical protein
MGITVESTAGASSIRTMGPYLRFIPGIERDNSFGAGNGIEDGRGSGAGTGQGWGHGNGVGFGRSQLGLGSGGDGDGDGLGIPATVGVRGVHLWEKE